jgi:hypothetical protein
MSITKKASLVELKKYFCPGENAAAFNEQRKQLTKEDQEELQDLLGTAIETGAVVLA